MYKESPYHRLISAAELPGSRDESPLQGKSFADLWSFVILLICQYQNHRVLSAATVSFGSSIKSHHIAIGSGTVSDIGGSTQQATSGSEAGPCPRGYGRRRIGGQIKTAGVQAQEFEQWYHVDCTSHVASVRQHCPSSTKENKSSIISDLLESTHCQLAEGFRDWASAIEPPGIHTPSKVEQTPPC